MEGTCSNGRQFNMLKQNLKMRINCVHGVLTKLDIVAFSCSLSTDNENLKYTTEDQAKTGSLQSPVCID